MFLDKILFACYSTKDISSTLCAEGGVHTEQTTQLITDDMSRQIVETARVIVLNDGADNLTVRKILKTLGITNRVFYNRFRNADEVLHIIYESTAVKMRESIIAKFDDEKDFFDQIIDIVANTLVMSYESKRRFSSFAFESDSESDENYIWWKTEIKRLIDTAKKEDLLKDVDSEAMSYAIWCFIRGYNADAISRGIDMKEAVKNFRYSFGILLDGMKAQK